MKAKKAEQSGIKTEAREITPKEAGEILDEHFMRIEKGNFRQRPISKSMVVKYAADIVNGNWLLTPQPISFDVKGNLIDGQHRLEAVRRANMPVKMMVSTGWPVSDNGHLGVIDVIDGGKPRSVAALLHMHGMNNAKATCAVLRGIVRIVHGGSSGHLSISSAKAMLELKEVVDGIERIRAQSQSSRDYLGRLVGPLTYYHTARPKKAEEFASSLFNFEVTKGSPVQVFLNWQKNKIGVHFDKHVAALCSALRLWDAGENEMQILKPTREAVGWLANQNPKLRDYLRRVNPRTKAN